MTAVVSVSDGDAVVEHGNGFHDRFPDPLRCALCRAEELAHVVDALRGHRYRWQDETQLQEGLALALTVAGLSPRREVRLTPTDRVDLLTGRVGIEVKVAGTVDAVLRQVQRYALSDLLDSVVVVTTRARHRALPPTVGGKPLEVIYLGGVA